MYSPEAKFEEHSFNISRDILDWVLYCFSETTYDVITLLTRTKKNLKNQKKYSKTENASSLYFQRPFN